MKDTPKLDDTLDDNYREHLDELKRELVNVNPPNIMEQDLLRAFDVQFDQVKWWQKWGGWSISGAVVASLMVAMVLFQSPSTYVGNMPNQEVVVMSQSLKQGLQVAPVAPVAQASNVSIKASESNESQISQEMNTEIPFISLDSKEVILQQDTMRIVQADIPMSVLASMGVSVNPQIAGETTRAEMLVGRDDELLAVRFLPN